MTTPHPAGRFDWERAVRRSDLPKLRKLVAFALATYADPDGTNARPGLEELADACSMPYSTVKAHMKGLRDDGWLERTVRGSSLGRRKLADEHHLTVPVHSSLVSPVPAEHGSLASPAPTEHGSLASRTQLTSEPDQGSLASPHQIRDQTKTNRSDAPITDIATAVVIDALRARTGKTVTAEHARLVTRQLLDGRPVRNRAAYVRSAIDRDPTPERFLPTTTPPPFRREETRHA
jgi:predicted RNA binding protein YcfA (HicA-like mRNA interferase family)